MTVIGRWVLEVADDTGAVFDVFDADRLPTVLADGHHLVEVVPAEQLTGAVGIIETARQELRDAIANGNPQILREYAQDAVVAMSAFLDRPGGQ